MSSLSQRLDQVQAQPLHRVLGIGAITATDGRASFDLTVGTHSANPRGALHGGVIYALCDVAAYAALLSLLADDEDAVTHDLHVSLLRPAQTGECVQFSAQVLRRGRSLAFIDAQALRGDTLLASARVTKSILHAD